MIIFSQFNKNVEKNKREVIKWIILRSQLFLFTYYLTLNFYFFYLSFILLNNFINYADSIYLNQFSLFLPILPIIQVLSQLFPTLSNLAFISFNPALIFSNIVFIFFNIVNFLFCQAIKAYVVKYFLYLKRYIKNFSTLIYCNRVNNFIILQKSQQFYYITRESVILLYFNKVNSSLILQI